MTTETLLPMDNSLGPQSFGVRVDVSRKRQS